MSTRYISALLSPDHASSVLGIRLRSTESSQQPVELGIIPLLKPDCEMRSLTGRKQLESVLRQAPHCRQVDHAETGEPAA
jgi:hypothetical protein